MPGKLAYWLFAMVASLAAAMVPCAAKAADPVVVVVKVFATPGREAELGERYLKQLEYLKQAEPRSSFRLHRSIDDPTCFLWYEVYESRQALDNHLKVVMPNFQKAFGPTPKGLIARPSEHLTYTQIGN